MTTISVVPLAERSLNLMVAFASSAIVSTSVAFAQTEVPAAEPFARLEEVVVQSSPLDISVDSLTEPAARISGQALRAKAEQSLGETLSREPGISASSFGRGASRPVIRGMDGDRIRILENGVGTQDVSSSSPDHAVTIEPALADSIEVIRGPASLLYRTSGIGGVVNVIDHRLSEALPDRDLEGMLEARGGTVDEEHAAMLDITAPAGQLALHLDGLIRKTDDYDIPGFARTREERDSKDLEFPEPKGKVPFSSTDTDTLGLGASYIFDAGFLGVSSKELDSVYGVPNGEKDISIDMERHHTDLKGEYREMGRLLRSGRVHLGITDYTHTELEGSEEGTRVDQEAVEGRMELAHAPIGRLEGLLGFHLEDIDFESAGEEAFQPPTDSAIRSLFVFETLRVTEQVSVELGARYESHSIDSDGLEPFRAMSRGFDTFSGSIGAVWRPSAEHSGTVSIAITERAPNGQELFANGPHVATGTFEVGDPDLDPEQSFGLEVTFGKNEGFVRGSIAGFYNRFRDYISLSPNGREIDDLPVFLYRPVDADFVGFEAEISAFPVDQPGRRIFFDVRADYVRAEDLDNDDPLPRIPPLRLAIGAHYDHTELFRADLELTGVFEQQRTADFETGTAGHMVLDAYVGKEIVVGEHAVELFLKGTNLLNDKVRQHTSFIKDIAPLPGASVVGGVRFVF